MMTRKGLRGVATAALAACLILVFITPAFSCVGKVLTIGIVASPQETVYAELISQIVTERTGTTVKIVAYRDVRELYGAVKKGDVGVIIENTERGGKVLERHRDEKGRAAYEELKREYRKSLNLVWLDPVPVESGSRYYAPVIAVETMGNLPALPKLINRLTAALTEEGYAKLVRAARGEEKPRRVVRDFLKSKRLI